MSAQFGIWNLDGKPVDRGYLDRVKKTLAPYGPDDETSITNGNIAILHHGFHTTMESRTEDQPHVCASGDVITWDGRLDNRADLISELCDPLTMAATDLDIIASAYEKWGTNCFAKLIGDWALSIWNPVERSLVLAKDPIGTHHLYYMFDSSRIAWSTVLDPLVRFAGKTFELNEEYIAGWLSMFPATHLTPFVRVHAVPASSFVVLDSDKRVVSKYWDFDPRERIRYRTDAEYEEHFRAVFTTAVQRTLRSDKPVLAELSGGRDSSSIVCMADIIIARGKAECPQLDTISYYDDSEPNWNERPYFTRVEAKRGRIGCHIGIGLHPETRLPSQLGSESSCATFATLPGSNGRCAPKFGTCMISQGNRVVLSGIGGDEVMGGVPTPVPELADLFIQGRLAALAQQLKVWALKRRKPWLHLFAEAVRGFFPWMLVGGPINLRPAPWLQTNFVSAHRSALAGYPARTKLFGPLPSFQENLAALDGLRRQVACIPLPSAPPYEKRYPYLDRELLEFIYAIPRDQLVRPTQRRSLMRRALVGIVPDEILNKKGKAFVTRAPLINIASHWPDLAEMTKEMLCSSCGIVDQNSFLQVLQQARHGEDVDAITLLRTIRIEAWLKNLHASGYIDLKTTGSRGASLQPMRKVGKVSHKRLRVQPPIKAAS